MLEGIDVFVGGLGLVGVMVTVAVWVLVLRTVEQPTRKMKVDKMMRMIVRSIYLRICSPDMRIILPGLEMRLQILIKHKFNPFNVAGLCLEGLITYESIHLDEHIL